MVSGCGCAAVESLDPEALPALYGPHRRSSLACPQVASESVDVRAAISTYWRVAGMEKNWGPKGDPS